MCIHAQKHRYTYIHIYIAIAWTSPSMGLSYWKRIPRSAINRFFLVAAQCQNATGHPPPYGLHPHWRILRCTRQQGAQWLTEGKSGPRVPEWLWQLGMYTHTHTHKLKHTGKATRSPGLCRSGCCQSLRNMDRWEWPCAQWTEGNLFLSDGWNSRRSCEIVNLASRNSSALLDPRDVTRKIWWRSLPPCYYVFVSRPQ